MVDGTGKPGFSADVRIEGDRIAAIGEIEPAPDEPVIDGRGLVLAPGFIDTHSHADTDTFAHRDTVAAVSQGVTTTVVGQDGESLMPLGGFFARLETEPTAVNMASYTGHGSLRVAVMGEDYARPASAEIADMGALLGRGHGGRVSRAEHRARVRPGIYSTTGEVVELARMAASDGGRYISPHPQRGTGASGMPSRRSSPSDVRPHSGQISHVKLADEEPARPGRELLSTLDEARDRRD